MKRDAQRGFTLIELMVSLVMFSFAMAGILAVAVTLSSGLREQRKIVALEDSARASIDFIADAIRGASPSVPSGNIQHVNTCATGAFTLVDSATDPDDLTLVFASGSVVTSTRSPYGTGTTVVTLTDVSQISVGDTLLISNLTQGHLVTVSAINATSSTVTLAAQSCATLALPAGGYAAGALVVRVQRARFYIDQIDGIPTLMMDPDAEGPAPAEPLAEGIEDLQIAEGVDTNADGAVTEVGTAANDDEWAYNVAGDTTLSGAIRAVRLTIVGRTTQAFNAAHPTFSRPAIENRAASTTLDGYRRRVLSSLIEVRNLEGSP